MIRLSKPKGHLVTFPPHIRITRSLAFARQSTAPPFHQTRQNWVPLISYQIFGPLLIYVYQCLLCMVNGHFNAPTYRPHQPTLIESFFTSSFSHSNPIHWPNDKISYRFPSTFEAIPNVSSSCHLAIAFPWALALPQFARNRDTWRNIGERLLFFSFFFVDEVKKETTRAKRISFVTNGVIFEFRARALQMMTIFILSLPPVPVLTSTNMLHRSIMVLNWIDGVFAFGLLFSP